MALFVELRNLHCRLVSSTPEEREWLSGYLSFEDSRARFRKAGPDARLQMFSAVSSQFPSGLLPLVSKAGAAEGFKVDVVDKRLAPCAPDPGADLGWLRDYQLEGVRRSIEKVRGILWLPTGAGKTEVACGVVRSLPCRWLFVVHRATLLDQAAERWTKRTGEPVGRVGDGLCELGERFTVASFQTLYQNLAELRGFLECVQGVIVDEVHTLPSETYWKVAMALPAAYYRLGVSGTPLARGDRRSVLAIAATGPVIYRIKPDVLISAGVLSRPKIRLLPVTQSPDKPTWQGVYGDAIVRSPERNRVVVAAARRAAKPCLVFVKEIAHGRVVQRMLEKGGLRCEFVWGSDSTDARKNAVKRLVRGDVDVLVCSVIFQEGVDIPELRSVVIASGGRSVIAALQRVGRGMRVSEGKTEFEVWDIKDTGHRWLERHTKERLAAYQKEGYETVVDSSVVA